MIVIGKGLVSQGTFTGLDWLFILIEVLVIFLVSIVRFFSFIDNLFIYFFFFVVFLIVGNFDGAFRAWF